MRRAKTLKRWLVLLTMALLASPLSGCGGPRNGTQKTGTLRMALTGQSNGITYRLRSATFDIAGPNTTTLDSETNPDATVLTATLATGGYSITLHDGWYLERLDGASFVQVQATLLSPSIQPFTIVASQTTTVTYRFSTDGTIVEIGNGTLDVVIDVTTTCAPPALFNNMFFGGPPAVSPGIVGAPLLWSQLPAAFYASLEFYLPPNPPRMPASLPVVDLSTQAQYQTCSACFLVHGTNQTYLAQSGTLNATSTSGQLTVALSNVVLREVTIDTGTNMSTLVPNGCQLSIGAMNVDVPIMPAP